MSTSYIVNGQVYLDGHFQEAIVAMEDEKLHLLPPDAPVSGEVYDAAGKSVVPGFIDIHTHGAVGVDVNGAAPEDLDKIARFFAGNGTTSWLCSVLTDTEAQTRWCIDQCKAYQSQEGGAAGNSSGGPLPGLHL